MLPIIYSPTVFHERSMPVGWRFLSLELHLAVLIIFRFMQSILVWMPWMVRLIFHMSLTVKKLFKCTDLIV